jgi:hypothetical protein
MEKNNPHFTFWTTEKFQSLFDGVGVCQMKTKILWRPFDNGVVSDSNQFFFIAIPHTFHCLMVTESFQSPRKVGMSHLLKSH